MWWCIILKILLITNNNSLLNMTNSIINTEHELIWETYAFLENNKKLNVDIVIIHYTKIMMQDGMLLPLVKVRTKFGKMVPILAAVEGGTPQQLFSVLRSGAYDYVDILSKPIGIYRKKICDITMWKWYLEKYCNEKK